MGVVRNISAASSSRHADVDCYPYSGRPGTARYLQPKQARSSYGHFQNFDQVLSPGTQLASPVLYNSNAFSPGAASWASGDSSEAGTSIYLARRRELSAAFYTPTSSTHASPSAAPDTSSQSRGFWTEHQHYINPYQQELPPDPSLSPPLALSGLGLPLKDNPFAGYQAYPFHNEEVLPNHTSSPPARQTRPGVRWRPLSLDARESAGAVRDSGGSCIRCFIMREKCDAEIPCTRCVTVSGRARSWKLPCTRKWLNERGEYLLPEVLTSQLDIKNVNDFINNKTFFALEGSVEVPLTIGFGEPLILHAVEVELIGPDLISMQGFAPGLFEFSFCSPPLVPCWPIDVTAVMSRVRSWMDTVLTQGGADYPEKCFPEPHPARHRNILSLIHQQYENTHILKDDTCVVTSAFRLSVAVYVMGHALTVPRSEINTLSSQLRHPDFQNLSYPEYQSPTSDSDTETSSEYDDSPPVSPRAINKVVKSLLLRLTSHLTTQLFPLLHLHLGPKPTTSTSFATAFSAAFLLLTSLAQIQTSVYERAVAGARADPPDLSFGMEDAAAEICRLEEQVASVVVSLFLWRWKGKGKGKKRNGSTSMHPTEKRARGTSIAGSNSSSSGSPPMVFTHVNGPTIGDSSGTDVLFRARLQAIFQAEKEEIKAAAKLELLLNGVRGREGEVLLNEMLFRGSGVENIGRILGRLCAPLIED